MCNAVGWGPREGWNEQEYPKGKDKSLLLLFTATQSSSNTFAGCVYCKILSAWFSLSLFCYIGQQQQQSTALRYHNRSFAGCVYWTIFTFQPACVEDILKWEGGGQNNMKNIGARHDEYVKMFLKKYFGAGAILVEPRTNMFHIILPPPPLWNILYKRLLKRAHLLVNTTIDQKYSIMIA